jgi:hypothetical protein
MQLIRQMMFILAMLACAATVLAQGAPNPDPALIAIAQAPQVSPAETAQICERIAAIASEAVLRAMEEQFHATPAAACLRARLEELGKVATPTGPQDSEAKADNSSQSARPPDGGVRNPFGVDDVRDPYGDDIRRFVARVRLSGGGSDRNAPQWAPRAADEASGELDGNWFSRWAVGTFGGAKIQVIGDRLFALYTDDTGRMAGRTWILEAIREDNRLIGRWVQVGNLRDTGPFFGLIVNNERIDGIWNWAGTERWDFRRRLPR